MHFMSKSTYFNGQQIFSTLLSLLSRDKIEQIATQGNYEVRCVNHLVTLKCTKFFID